MIAFLSFIFYLFLGFWLFGIISRWLLKYWIIKKQRQMEQQMKSGQYTNQSRNGQGNFSWGPFSGAFYDFTSSGGNQNNRQDNSNNKHEGEITVDGSSQSKSHSVSKTLGEYVEFTEEVEDTKNIYN